MTGCDLTGRGSKRLVIVTVTTAVSSSIDEPTRVSCSCTSRRDKRLAGDVSILGADFHSSHVYLDFVVRFSALPLGWVGGKAFPTRFLKFSLVFLVFPSFS